METYKNNKRNDITYKSELIRRRRINSPAKDLWRAH